MCICDAVLDELNRGTDDLHKWAKEYPSFVCPATQEDIDLAKNISDAYPDWVREDKNAADPFIVAHGSTSERTIVTDERAAGAGVQPQNQKIPNVANAYSVVCIDFFTWARGQGWSF